MSCDAFLVKPQNNDDSGIGIRRDLVSQGNSRRSSLPDIRDLLSTLNAGDNSTNSTTNSTNPTNSTNSTAAPSPSAGDPGDNSTATPTDAPTSSPTENNTTSTKAPSKAPSTDSTDAPGDNSDTPSPTSSEVTLKPTPTSTESSESQDGPTTYEPTYSAKGGGSTPSPTDYPTEPIATREPSKSPSAGFLNSEEEELKRLAKDKTADILAILIAVFGLLGMILTAWQILENPDGLCTSCCRLVVKASSFLLKVMFLPCKLCCNKSKGYNGTNAADPNTSMFVGSEQFNTMEMT